MAFIRAGEGIDKKALLPESMRKIATTTSGTVIAEIPQEQFEALEKILGASKQGTSENPSKTLTRKELVDYVSIRLAKLRPKKLASLEKSIATMFNFNGGIEASEISEIITSLKNRKLIFVDDGGKVSYPAT